MATNVFTQTPLSATGVKPAQWFLSTTVSYDELIAPGFLSSAAGTGIDIQPNDFVFVQYDAGQLSGIFTCIQDGEVLSLEVYSPNDNSFHVENTRYVAKGGSDLNPGDTMGLPKLTIQAAIDSLSMVEGANGLVVVLDPENYDENLTLPFDINIFAPSASLVPASGDAITIDDTGTATIARVYAKTIVSNDGNVISLNGSLSNLFLTATIMQGNIYNEGGLIFTSDILVQSELTVTSTAKISAKVSNCSGCIVNVAPGGQIGGELQSIPVSGAVEKTLYGNVIINDELKYTTTPVDLTIGKTLELSDNNSRIVYSSPTDDDFILPTSTASELPIGTNVEFTQLGLGAVNFVADVGVTIVSAIGPTVATNGAGSSAKAWLYTDDIWVISGDITAVGP